MSDWIPVLIAFGILFLVGGLAFAAIMRYDSKDAIPVLSWVGTIFGTILGMVGTFFFTKDQLDTTKSNLADANVKLERKEELLVQSKADLYKATEQLALYENQIEYLNGTVGYLAKHVDKSDIFTDVIDTGAFSFTSWLGNPTSKPSSSEILTTDAEY